MYLYLFRQWAIALFKGIVYHIRYDTLFYRWTELSLIIRNLIYEVPEQTKYGNCCKKHLIQKGLWPA
jgi:hypothetical protein